MASLSLRKRSKKVLKYLKRAIPYKIEKEEDGYKLKATESSFNPSTHDGRVYLIVMDGQDSRPIEVTKHGDDRVLEYEDKICAITSKPLLIDQNQFYFTRDNYLGTIALNKETLLGADVWQKAGKGVKRKISKDVNFERIPFNIDEKKVDEDEDYYYVRYEDVGDIASLSGSKKTLKDMNKAKRVRKLLKPAKVDKKKLLMAVGSGIALGFYLYPQIQG